MNEPSPKPSPEQRLKATYDARDQQTPLFSRPPYLLFLASRFAVTLATVSQTVIIGWEVYEIARRTMPIEQSALALGMIGLVEFLPMVALALVAGEAADRYDRRRILASCYFAELLTAGGLLLRSSVGGGLLYIFVLATFFGCTRAFFMPTASALAPMFAPPLLLPRVIAANSLASQTALILGPALGGVLIGVSPVVGYYVSACLYGFGVVCLSLMNFDARPAISEGRSRLAQIREGLAYVWTNKLVFGAISLDLFAVLLGGATALLPVFARDVLHVDSRGYGVLRAAPAAGALLVAGYLIWRPIATRAGRKMLWAVAVFGVATLLFASSREFWVSVAALVVLGGADMVSVFTRQSLIQIATPDALRGRVLAVSTLFIGASNELGEFESGVAARFLGPIGAAGFGGFGAIFVTALWAWLFPSLRKADRLT